MATVAVSTLIEKMKLDNLTPEIDVSAIKITQPDINRPALQLAGYIEHFESIEELKAASVETLMEIPAMNALSAKRVYEFFHAKEVE